MPCDATDLAVFLPYECSCAVIINAGEMFSPHLLPNGQDCRHGLPVANSVTFCQCFQACSAWVVGFAQLSLEYDPRLHAKCKQRAASTMLLGCMWKEIRAEHTCLPMHGREFVNTLTLRRQRKVMVAGSALRTGRRSTAACLLMLTIMSHFTHYVGVEYVVQSDVIDSR